MTVATSALMRTLALEVSSPVGRKASAGGGVPAGGGVFAPLTAGGGFAVAILYSGNVAAMSPEITSGQSYQGFAVSSGPTRLKLLLSTPLGNKSCNPGAATR